MLIETDEEDFDIEFKNQKQADYIKALETDKAVNLLAKEEWLKNTFTEAFIEVLINKRKNYVDTAIAAAASDKTARTEWQLAKAATIDEVLELIIK